MIDWIARALSNLGLSATSSPVAARTLALAFVALLSFVTYFLTRRVILNGLARIAKRTRVTWDDILVSSKAFPRLAHISPALVIYLAAPLVLPDVSRLVLYTRNGALVYMITMALLAIDAGFDAGLQIYQSFEISKRVHIKSLMQVLKIFIFTAGGVLVLSVLTEKNPMVFLGGLGAMTAVLLLIFKDSILGFVAGVQLSMNNMVQRGDWIEMPKYDADGDVIDVALMTVKVQNWDKTITMIPTYALISESFKNWRGMQESGGRRIKRSVNIDVASVRFCDDAMIERFKKFHLIRGYIDAKLVDIQRHNEANGVDTSVRVNGRRLTNLGMFRAYVNAYIASHPSIHKDMTRMVRQLAPTAQGIPMEIYAFTNDSRWVNYEGIQGDIFDHVLAVVPEFDLRIYQQPSGTDVSKLAGPRPASEAKGEAAVAAMQN